MSSGLSKLFINNFNSENNPTHLLLKSLRRGNMFPMPTQWMIPAGRDHFSLVPVERLIRNCPPVNMYACTPLPMNVVRIGRVNPYLTVPNFRDPFGYVSNHHWSPVQPVRFCQPHRRFSKDSLGEAASSSDGSFSGSRPETPVPATASASSDIHSKTASISGEHKEFPTKGLKRQLKSKQSPKHNHPSTSSNSKHPATKRQRKHSDNQTVPVQNSAKNGSGLDKLSQQIWEHYSQNKQTMAIHEQKLRLRAAIQDVLDHAFNSRCDICIVGSTTNGFGTTTSDVDMCLILSNSEVNQQTEAMEILKYIFRVLSKCSFVSHPQIINAKVPLLRFTDSNTGLEADLNVSNTVGIKNTNLLKCYAYRGCVPPVIPCLQRMRPNSFSTISETTGINAYNLPHFKSKNEHSLGELFIGFLDYYSNKFNFSKEAISIRLGCKLPKHVVIGYKSEKNKRGHWKYICIEEPFDHTNTACSVYEDSPFQNIITAFKTCWMKLKDHRDLKSILNV